MWLCSIFLDTQLPGAREVIDPEGLFLGQADIARLPSIHPRASELEFLKDLRALEVHSGPAAEQYETQRESPPSRDPADQAQRAQQAHPEDSQPAELLRMLSAGHLHDASEDAMRGSKGPSPRKRGVARFKWQATEAPASPKTPPKKRKSRQSRAQSPMPASSARINAAYADMDVQSDSDDENDEGADPDYTTSIPRSLGAAAHLGTSRKRGRKRPRRSEDNDPAWQPLDNEVDRSSSPKTSLLRARESMAVTTRTPAREISYAPAAHIPKSKYKGVSCHK